MIGVINLEIAFEAGTAIPEEIIIHADGIIPYQETLKHD